eukprot:1700733-Amphidinium_carterae.1
MLWLLLDLQYDCLAQPSPDTQLDESHPGDLVRLGQTLGSGCIGRASRLDKRAPGCARSLIFMIIRAKAKDV